MVVQILDSSDELRTDVPGDTADFNFCPAFDDAVVLDRFTVVQGADDVVAVFGFAPDVAGACDCCR